MRPKQKPASDGARTVGCVIAALLVLILFVIVIGGNDKPAAPGRADTSNDNSPLMRLARETDDARARAPNICANLKGDARRRQAECLLLDCPGSMWPLCQRAAAGHVEVGMTPCQVEAVWGQSTHSSLTTTASGMVRHLSYGARRRVMYDEDGLAAVVSED